jgi:hypothetical protein
MGVSQVRQITQLWADGGGCDVADTLARLEAGNRARDDMLAGIITIADWLDVLNDLGLNVDQFCDDVEHDLRQF